MNKIYFYVPHQQDPALFQKNPDEWFGLSNNFFSWILRTYLYLKKRDFPCEIINHIPEAGILLADRDSLGDNQNYLGRVMLICTKGDREFHPSAHLHIVHNPLDFQDNSNSVWNPYYIPHWPQPGLLPRAKTRECLVENVAFIGNRSQLAEQLKSEKWINALDSLGCKWLPIFKRNKWHNYTNIDLVVAARSFDKNTYKNKPASKLVNCWRAGVPAILAPESAFMSERKSELDFIPIDSVESAISAVKKLKNDPQLYSAMVNNAGKRAEEFSSETNAEKWIAFYNEFAFPAYKKWSEISEVQRRTIFLRRYLKLKLDRMKTRIGFNR